MDAARRGGVSWGMADDAALEEDLENVTEGTASNVLVLQSLALFHILSADAQWLHGMSWGVRDEA